MYQMIYTSRPTKEFSQDELSELLDKARFKNKSKEITGILLYSNQIIIQLLEGPQDEVLKLYDLISTDSRHTELEVAYQGDCKDREFKNWIMGFRFLNADLLESIGLLNLVDGLMLDVDLTRKSAFSIINQVKLS